MASGRAHVSAQGTCIVLIDLACLLLGGGIAIAARIGPDEFGEYVGDHLDGWIVFFGSVVLANYLAGSYRLQNTFSRFNLVVTWAFSILFALVVLSLTSYAWFNVLLGRGVLLIWAICYSVLVLGLKMLVFRDLFRSSFFLCRVAVLGAGPVAQEVRRMLEQDYVMPAHRVTVFILVNGADESNGLDEVGGIPVVRCAPEELRSLVMRLGVRLLVLGAEGAERVSDLYSQVRRLRFEGVEIMSPLGVAELYAGRTPLDLVNEEALTNASMESDLPLVSRAKRLADILLSLTALLVLLPLLVLLALVGKALAPRSPVFYSQVRVGRFGSPFKIHKFRTMRDNAEAVSGPVWASRGDPRITPWGRVLRRYRLDELPQLWNILAGEMSVVGPRPERPAISAELSRKIPFFTERESVLPGLTGWAQIRHPYGSTVEDAVRKLEYDLYYIKHVSLSLDLQIILSTLRIVLLGKEWGR